MTEKMGWKLVDFVTEKEQEIENFIGRKVNIDIRIEELDGKLILDGGHYNS